MRESHEGPAASPGKPERRAYRCVTGPFDAVVGLLEFHLRISICVGGCFVDSPTQVKPDQPIRLRIALPDGKPVTVRGIVTPPPRDVGYAVRFVDPDESTREAIAQALTTSSRSGRRTDPVAGRGRFVVEL